ncbi:hypothetical protein ABPG75_010049 [Micractinium tetrahymenae]
MNAHSALLPSVKRQHASLRIDTAAQSFTGWTELHVVPPPPAAAGGAATLGLHCYGLAVQAVHANGAAVPFELQPAVREELPESVTGAAYDSPGRAAGAVAEYCLYMYERQLQRERQPELTFQLPDPLPPLPAATPESAGTAGGSRQQDGRDGKAAGGGRGKEAVIRVEWSCPGGSAGLRFWQGYALTDNQVRRASAWLPCVDVPSASVRFTLDVTCRADQMAVGPGQLQRQRWADPERRWRTFCYELPLSCAPCHLGLTVGPLAAEATTHVPKQALLGARFPLPAMQQAFLPPELLLGQEGQALAGLQVLGTSHLIQPRAIEQSIAARCAIARCLARQWFGVLVRAATPLDEWLIEGLSGWLEEQCAKRYMGRNELAYRRWRERQAIFLADTGEAPPLAARGVPSPSPWGPLYGTERLDPARLWSTKATAVVAMLEKRAGEDLFRKHVGNVVAAALAALAAEQAAAAGAGEGAAAGTGAASAAAAGAVGAASGAAGPSPLKAGGPGGGGEGGVAPTRLLDTMTFLNDLGRAGSFRKEMAPFAVRWVYGRGVPRIAAAFIYHGRLSALELALKQTGSESAKLAADVAQRAAVAEGSNAGIVKAIVREAEGDQYADHPVHLGGEAFVLAELKVTPVVEKKQPGRRGKKRKAEGEGEEGEEADETAGAPQPENPVRWVRLDPAGELLCDIRLLQPERMLAAQLLHSRDVVAQAEAIQRLGELRVTSEGVRLPVGLEALRKTLADRTVFYSVRCDAAMALAGLRDEQGQAAGLPVLLDFYRGAYFHPGSDAPRTVAIADPSEYFVAQAVVTAVSLCREADGTTPIDALLFLSTCLNDYSTASGAPFSDYGLVAAMCASLGNVRFEGFGDTLLTLLEKFLERDAVLISPGSAVGCACLLAMAALCASGTCDEEQAGKVAVTARRVRKSPGLPVALRHAAMAAALQLAAAQRGPAAALQLALAGAASGLHSSGSSSGGGGSSSISGQPGAVVELPAASSPAFLLEEAAAIVTAANADSAATAAASATALGEAAAQGAVPSPGVVAPMQLLQQLASLLNEGSDCRLRHLAFVLLQLLAVQPPTLYRPPPTEADDLAAFIAAPAAGAAPAAPAGQALSMGVTHRTGGGPQPSQGTAAAAAAAAAPRIRLQLPTGRPAGARSIAISGASRPALSGEDPAMSDARVAGEGGGAGETVEQQFPGLPPAAQGQLFSPARHGLEAAAPAVPAFDLAGFGQGEPASAAAVGGPLGADIVAAFGSVVPLPQLPMPAAEPAVGTAALPPAPAPGPAAAAAPGRVRLKVAGAGQQAPAGPAGPAAPAGQPMQQQLAAGPAVEYAAAPPPAAAAADPAVLAVAAWGPQAPAAPMPGLAAIPQAAAAPVAQAPVPAPAAKSFKLKLKVKPVVPPR